MARWRCNRPARATLQALSLHCAPEAAQQPARACSVGRPSAGPQHSCRRSCRRAKEACISALRSQASGPQGPSQPWSLAVFMAQAARHSLPTPTPSSRLASMRASCGSSTKRSSRTCWCRRRCRSAAVLHACTAQCLAGLQANAMRAHPIRRTGAARDNVCAATVSGADVP